jgi:phage tail sheath protein FI
MPVPLSYPGVYIEEIPSGVHTITGVATSITAFVGRALRGPVNVPVRVQSFAEFERAFGGLWVASTLGYAVSHFFANGGGDALIVHVTGTGAAAATITYNGLAVAASSPGLWGNKLRMRIEDAPGGAFNLTIKDTASGVTERFLNLSVDAHSPRFVTNVVEQGSSLATVTGVPATSPAQNGPPAAGADIWADATASTPFAGGDDGGDIGDTDIQGSAAGKTGIWALEKADLFNLLCVPPLTPTSDIGLSTRDAAAGYCKQRRALFVVDPLQAWATHTDAILGVDAVNFMSARSENAALFFPALLAADPLREGQIGEFAPCGAVAGVMARTDATRGVWKAPAGIEATLNGVSALSVKLTDGENGQLNPLGVNCLRSFPVIGRVVWGARTMRGADQLADQWKYIPVRRLALFLEESLFRGTQWVVFEPNDEPLWAQIRLNIGGFMHNLFRQGAFQGMTPRDAYFVKCDKDTTTQNDIDLGVVNIVVGFAPLKPAEFVVIKIQQIAGSIET